MGKVYWEQFKQTGKVEDYLHYKGMETCTAVLQKYEEANFEQVGEDSGESISNSDRYRSVSDTYRGIR